MIADCPIPSGLNVRGFNHSLGECDISFFAAPTLAAKLDKKFPDCLNGAPFLMPGEATDVQGKLLRWFETHRLYPQVIGEFDDSSLMKTFGQAGMGIFIAPTPIASEIEEQYDVIAIGQTEQIREHFYAISVERKISHPAVAAITETARDWLIPNLGRKTKKVRSRKRA